MMASSSTLNRAESHEPAEVPRLVNHTAARLEVRYRATGEADEIGPLHVHDQPSLGDPARATAAHACDSGTAVRAARS
jgi:hypothetical protein